LISGIAQSGVTDPFMPYTRRHRREWWPLGGAGPDSGNKPMLASKLELERRAAGGVEGAHEAGCGCEVSLKTLYPKETIDGNSLSAGWHAMADETMPGPGLSLNSQSLKLSQCHLIISRDPWRLGGGQPGEPQTPSFILPRR